MMSTRNRRRPNERLLIPGALGVASAISVALELWREHHFVTTGYRFLLWNLFLAWIPVVLALVIYDHYRRGTTPRRLVVPALLWLLFLPNAPYIFTDFIHLAPTSGVPLWFDGTMLSAFAWTGVLLCFVSVYLVHSAIRYWYGAQVGWIAVLGVLTLTSAGVYLGRFMHWNSWDLLLRPGRRIAEVAAGLSEPTAVARAGTATMLVATMLAVTYVTFYALLSLRLDPVAGTDRRSGR